MRALLVTSRVTFVPGNYDALVLGLAGCDQIGGLLILDNRSVAVVRQALGLLAIGAPRLGWTLLRNALMPGDARRRAAYAAHGKPCWALPTINSPDAVAHVRRNGFDLVLNARTRFIYKREILAAPRLGCLNIHHGLLPEQRGTMCDLWALAEGQPAGFSLHVMAPAIDAGEILARVVVAAGHETDYLAHVARSAAREFEAARRVLAEIAAAGEIHGTPNVAPPGLAYRRNPTPAQIREMRRQGLRL